MSDELAIAAIIRVLRTADELRSGWDGTTIDDGLRRLLENLARDLEDALDYMPGSFNATGDEA